ncbi:MAG: pyridoxine 5'-phosphate synthase [Planctomycetota bacterium]
MSSRQAPPRLHVNVDHVATLRQARRELFPDPIAWAERCLAAGAHGITCHVRKDRRHIQDADLRRMRESMTALINLEVSLDAEMLTLAEGSRADAFCLVPEHRLEITTEGGMNVVRELPRLLEAVPRLSEAGGLVSIFVDPDPEQLEACARAGAPFVELHTGSYANARGALREAELGRLSDATRYASQLGLRVNAGHGLDYENVGPIAALDGVEELNIGFALVAQAVFDGVDAAVRDMLARIADGARA